MTSIELIKAERIRQIGQLGYTADHDDVEPVNSHATAAAVYALPESMRQYVMGCWPWDISYFKPAQDGAIDSRIRELVKAGALICAEIDKLQRMKNRK